MTASDDAGAEAREPQAGKQDAVRRRRRAEVFGETLPDATSDERDDGWGERVSGESDVEEWLRRQVPPHHD